jgi:hypothetical protein
MTKTTQQSALEPRVRDKTKAPYTAPRLEVLGSLRSATLGSGPNNGDAGQTMMAGLVMMSDRRAKQCIHEIGRHRLGLGVYLFSYRAPFDEVHGAGRQIGFMADEVAAQYPDAVSTGADGYLRVDYGRLLQ